VVFGFVMSKYVIYCDESEKNGKNYSDFFGGLLVTECDIELINHKILVFRQVHNYTGELKWSKTCSKKLEMYKKYVDEFFKIISEFDLKVRIFFRHNANKPSKNLTQNHKEKSYFYLYNQFLRHHFGLKYSNIKNVRIYADVIPDSNKDKILEFKRYVCKAFNDQGIILKDDDISEVLSHEHSILQFVDIVLGAMQFRLNDKHLERINKKIPNKTRAKIELYTYINCLIRGLNPQDRYKNFNIGISGKRIVPDEIYTMTWRHWSFIPNK